MKYVVLNEHTLGFLIPDRPGWMGVLAGKPQLGGHDWKNGPTVFFDHEIREATLTDFEFFRVCPKGHLT